MRVLMTADTVGGVWTYAVELATALRDHDAEVVLATMGRPLSPSQWTEAGDLKVAESSYALEWMDDPWDDVDRAGEWLLDIARDVRPDVVHLNGYAHAALPWGAPTVVVAYSDVLSWWRHVRGTEAPPEWDTYRARTGAGLDAATALVAPTRAVLADLGRDGTVIPNGRGAGWVRDLPKEPLVLTAGRLWDEAKNAAALDRVRDRLPYEVRIVGEPFLPFDEVADLMCRAYAFVLPARYEPFGLAALEAALAGCRLVLGDVASLREVWGGAAAYVPPDDDDGLVAAITSPLPDPRERARTYTPERMARSYLDLYRGLA